MLPAASITKHKTIVCYDDPRFPGVHCSSIQAAEGRLYCVWFGGSKEGASDVKIWFSRKNGEATWSEPKCIAGEPDTTHWNPVIFLPDESTPERLLLFYKTGSIISAWVTYWMESTDGGETWSGAEELVPGDRSGGRGPQKNPVLIATNGDWLCGSSHEVSLPSGQGKWDVYLDIAPRPTAGDPWRQGERWERTAYVELPADRGVPGGSHAGEGVIQPTLWEFAQEKGHFGMLMRSSNGWAQRSDSCDFGRTWTPAHNSSLPNNNSGLCVARMRDGRLACAHNTSGVNWGWRSPLVLSISSDEGQTWIPVTTIDEKPVLEGISRRDAILSGVLRDGDIEFSYPTVIATAAGDDNGVWVSYTSERRGIVVVKVAVEEKQEPEA